jgi:hypothetical protein
MYIEDKFGGKQSLLLSVCGKGKLQPCPPLGTILKPTVWVPLGILKHQFNRYRLLTMT